MIDDKQWATFLTDNPIKKYVFYLFLLSGVYSRVSEGKTWILSQLTGTACSTPSASTTATTLQTTTTTSLTRLMTTTMTTLRFVITTRILKLF